MGVRFVTRVRVSKKDASGCSTMPMVQRVRSVGSHSLSHTMAVPSASVSVVKFTGMKVEGR